jgi:hypothetical protein
MRSTMTKAARFLAIAIPLSIAGEILGQDNSGPPAEFQLAYRLAGEKKYAESLEIFDGFLARGEHLRNTLFSAGTIAMLAGESDRGRNYFLKLRELEPKSGRVRAALIRANQALGDLAAREEERAELFRLRKSRDDQELLKQDSFVRDEFLVDGKKVAAIEYFELQGDRAVRYSFLVMKPDSNEVEFRVSLGSYTGTNAAWRETRKPKPKKGDLLFHLDAYFPNGSHSTLGFHFPEPSYDETREMVVRFIRGRKL